MQLNPVSLGGSVFGVTPGPGVGTGVGGVSPGGREEVVGGGPGRQSLFSLFHSSNDLHVIPSNL